MPATLKHCIPILRVTDATAAGTYYVDRLGFTKEWEHRYEPGFPLFISIKRDGVQLFMSEHTGDGAPNTHIYVSVDAVDALHEELSAAGADLQHPPQDAPYGMREIRVKDLDENLIVFGTPIEGEGGAG